MKKKNMFFKINLFVLTVFAFVLTIAAVSDSSAAEPKVVVVTVDSDYTAGAHSVIDVDPVGGPRTGTHTIDQTISDLTVVTHGKYFYRIERYNSNTISKYDINSPGAPIWEYDTRHDPEDNPNPHDLVFATANKAYLIQFGTSDICIVDPGAAIEANFHTGGIDISSYEDSDGIPEASQGIIVDGKLFVTIKRLDRNDGWSLPNTCYIAVFDTVTDTEIDTGYSSGTVLGIPLDPYKAPSNLEYRDGKIYVQCTGRHGSSYSGRDPEYTGGILTIDPDTYTVTPVLDDGDDTTHPYGLITGISIVSSTKGYFTGYAGWGDNTLYSFNPSTGADIASVTGLIGKGLFLTPESVDGNNHLWISNQTDHQMEIINVTTDTIDESIDTGFNPAYLALIGNRADIDGDGAVGAGDMSALFSAWKTTPADPAWNAAADIYPDEKIDASDYSKLMANWGEGL